MSRTRSKPSRRLPLLWLMVRVKEWPAMSYSAARWYSSALLSCRSSLLAVLRWVRDAADARAVFGRAFPAGFRAALRAGDGFCGCG
ncbi:hypothetical protein ACFY30_37185 [Streptomyces sp. NPDC000345]|uniref:hypothetical protein n=1 Tax=Streptomyces sp. NPDC000345 TaxID=3364537 RepID=UPI00367369F4